MNLREKTRQFMEGIKTDKTLTVTEKGNILRCLDAFYDVAQQEIAFQVETVKDRLQTRIEALQLAILSVYKPKIERLERERGLQKQKLRSILEDMQKIPERRLPLGKIGWLQEWGDVIVALGRLLE